APQNQDHASSHVFATMLAHAFRHRQRSAVAHGKALACRSRHKKFTRSRTVQNGVARQHITAQRRLRPGRDRTGSSAQPFAYIVFGPALKAKGNAESKKRSKALSRSAVKLKINQQCFPAGDSRLPHQLSTKMCSHAAVAVHDGKAALERTAC